MKYAGKKAVVTGGTHGMGLAVVRALLDGGAEVLLTGRDVAGLSLPGKAHALSSDASRLSDIDELAAVAADRLGELDLVFINVGFATLTPYQETTPEIYDRTFDVNTKGAYFTAQRLAGLVRPGGSFVFTTSVAAGAGIAGMGPYSAAKAAVRSFALTYAAELAPRGIRVNVVSPGYTDTPTMGVTGVPPEVLASFKAAGDEITPLRRHATVQEVAAAVLFLAFEATYTTGADLPVDGGLGQRLTLPA
ncbi:SDR family NAD(P)-dependent oxidoreductase [Amycolatopsis australiensis]|uniref:NAD(P)-dependent dehydrogenase, short-chain alcohol dehydrogenase family n=1 Tax=Amycolatopsis australiensis TaxID=546364 RepID=A0A1K1P7W9_9PSEU|nr:SDR family oxidoreductase [Amycolatopsis australiensis]SFW43585.1 NAD(P)-dependent dehydrogenase, short-chain alcohol dehydrogenase family [Amycolatopsis australiensis]